MAAGFPVVGIDASAGGVEALEAFFAAMPSECGMAFLVVTHVDPKHESRLADIVGRRTTMPVTSARDGDVVEPQRSLHPAAGRGHDHRAEPPAPARARPWV